MYIQLSKRSGEFEELKEAQTLLQTFEKHVFAKKGVEDAIKTKDAAKLRCALNEAEILNMDFEVIHTAQDLLHELESKQIRETIKSNDVAYDVLEEQRKTRQEMVKQVRFEAKNFPNLRSVDDFVRGSNQNKVTLKANFLTFQSDELPKSLTVLSSDLNKRAVQMFQNIQGYCGDRQLPYPASLASEVLRLGYEFKELRDEIYLQIIKQVTNNPKPESVAKGWQLICMSVGTFPPSAQFENYLLNFVVGKRDRGAGAVVDYARYSLRTLEAMISNGDGTGFVPGLEEILSYSERPPILATIYLVDGNIITENLPLTPDLNVGKVLEMCSGWLDLKDPRIDTLGMFVYDMGLAAGEDPHAGAAFSDLPRSPRPLRNDDFMGDVIIHKARQKRRFKFVLKRKIFLPSQNDRGSDPFFERMTYLQAEDEINIQGNLIPKDEEEAFHFAALSMAVAYGEEMPSTVEEMIGASVIEFIPPDYRKRLSAEQWAGKILEIRDALVTSDPEDLQDQYLQLAIENPMYGAHWFYVHKKEPSSYVGTNIPTAVQQLPRDLMLAYNAEGMHIFNFSRQKLMHFKYSDIYRWGGSLSEFSLILTSDDGDTNFEFVLITAQAPDMAAIILDHIRAIMAESEIE